MAHLHNVYDSDSHFVIDAVTRNITNESSKKTMVMQYDHNSERFTFELPRTVEGHDMSLCDRIEVHYLNIDASDKSKKITGIYEVDDLQISPDDKNIVVFSWLLSQNVTQYAGNLSFIIRFACVSDDNTVSYVWNTAIYTGISVASGILNNAEMLIEPYLDVLAQWKADIFGMGDTQEARILSVSSEQMAAITAEGEKQVSAVAGKGAAVLESIPDEYETVSALADNNYRNKAGAILLDAEGENIIIKDSSEYPLHNLKVFGKSEQKTTKGINLFNPLNVVNGYPYNMTDLFVENSANRTAYILCEPNTTYTVSKMVGNRFALGYTTEFPANDVSVYGYVSDYDAESLTITTGSNAVYLIAWVYNGNVDTAITPADMLASIQIEKGDTASDYEPYTGGVASPSPEYPQDINSVENVAIKIYGKNLLKPKARTETINGVTFTFGNDGTVIANGTATKPAFFAVGSDFSLMPDKNYVLSGCPDGGAFDTYMLYIHYNDSGFDVYNRTGETKFTAKAGKCNAVVVVYEGITVSNLVFRPMVRFESVESGDFEAYTEQNISIPRTLHGIPVSNGGNYTDESGQQWICDEVDLARGVYVRRLRTETFDGSNADYWWEYNSPGYEGYARTLSDMLSGVRWNGYCNRFPAHLSASTEPGLWFGADNNVLYLHSTKELFSTLNQFKDWLTANPMVVVYPIANPIETALSDAEITAFKALHSNKPTTTILNDCGAYMAAEYIADTKTYIDNKFAELNKE